jgi:hypothetical protein
VVASLIAGRQGAAVSVTAERIAGHIAETAGEVLGDAGDAE